MLDDERYRLAKLEASMANRPLPEEFLIISNENAAEPISGTPLLPKPTLDELRQTLLNNISGIKDKAGSIIDNLKFDYIKRTIDYFRPQYQKAKLAIMNNFSARGLGGSGAMHEALSKLDNEWAATQEKVRISANQIYNEFESNANALRDEIIKNFDGFRIDDWIDKYNKKINEYLENYRNRLSAPTSMGQFGGGLTTYWAQRPEEGKISSNLPGLYAEGQYRRPGVYGYSKSPYASKSNIAVLYGLGRL